MSESEAKTPAVVRSPAPLRKRDTIKAKHAHAADPTPKDVVFDDARYRDIAIRILAGEPKKVVAAKNSVSPRQLRNIMHNKNFLEVYEQERDRLYDDINALLKNEKAADLVRAHAMKKRGMTLLAEVMETVQERMKTDELLGPGMLRVGVDAATGAIDRADKMVEVEGGGSTVNVGAVVVGQADAVSINAALEEAEIDLSDIMQNFEASREVIDVQAEEIDEQEDD